MRSRIRRTIGGGIIAGLALALWAAAHATAPAQAAVLYDQLGGNGSGLPSEDVQPPHDAFDAQVADDFTVPAGETWSITSIDLTAFSFDALPTSFDVFFYADGGALPGALIDSRSNVPFTGSVAGVTPVPFTIGPFAPVVLPAGSYWVSVQANTTNYSTQRWYWEAHSAAAGDQAVWQNPGGGYALCPTWCSSFTAGAGPNFSFRLNGSLGLTGDLGIFKTDNSPFAVPGAPITYTITASNAGPDTATGATVTDNFPADISGVTWSCVASAGSSCPMSGVGNINALVTLLPGGTATFTATGMVSPNPTGTSPNTLSNAAFIAPPLGFTDTNPGNDQWVDDDFFLYKADVSITKSDGSASEVPGTPVTYTITASNAGPSSAAGAQVTDNFPATVIGVTWTCAASAGSTCPTGGNGDINATVGLQPGGTATFTAMGTIDPAATGTLSNTASIAPGSFVDENTDNNSSTDTDTLTPQGDLSITKTDNATAETPGTPVTYTITASNAGPSNTSATVTDFFPASITGVSWSCLGGAGGVCPAGGMGDINTAVSLPSGSSVTFIATGTIDPAATGSLTNTATITGPAGFDTDPSNNSATDTDTLSTEANVGVDKSCPAGPVLPGEQFTCTITVSNAGPSDAQNITVTDNLPDNVTLVGTPIGAGFTCGTGDPFTCTRPTLTAGQSATISVTLRVNDDVPGGAALTNSVTVGSTTTDPDPSNNNDTATTSLPACTVDLSNATGPQSIRGTAGDDVICGSAYNDSIQGLGGNDIIFGNGGNDSIQGGEGNDRMFGGAGDDTISGPPGVDAANGGAGYDRCIARTNTNCEASQIA